MIVALIFSKRILNWIKLEKPSQIRSFDRLIKSFENSNWNKIDISDDIFVLEPKEIKEGQENILITAGVHGSEPAGVFALEEILQELPYAKKNIWIIPCVNKYGFIFNDRADKDGEDLNRHFNIKTDNKTVKPLVNYLKNINKRFQVTLDLHETTNEDVRYGAFKGLFNPRIPMNDGAFLYQTVNNGNYDIAKNIIDNLKKSDVKLTSLDNIWEEPCINHTVTYPEARVSLIFSAKDTLEDFCAEYLTDNAITAETMAYEPLEERIEAHKTIIRTVLDY